MPTVIDSIFIQLGIDVSKFSADQQKALKKIQDFESQAKRSASSSSAGITAAFKDVAKIAGGSEAAIGGVARGLGMLLSPATLGASVVVSILGKEMWDFNKAMVTANASIQRQSQLSDMSAKSLWSWGDAARAVGGNPGDVTGGISGLQKSIAGMMIGAGDATPQLVALARLGVGWNAQSGLTDAQVTQMFVKAHQQAKARGYKNLGSLSAMLDPIMNKSMQDIAFDPAFDPAKLKAQIQASAPANLNATLANSLKDQAALGQLGIKEDVLKEVAAGGLEGTMSAAVTILDGLLTVTKTIADAIVHPIDTTKRIYHAAVDAVSRGIDQAVDLVHRPSAGISTAMRFLMGHGYSKLDAEAIAGNFAAESGMNPLARNGSHIGIAQWDTGRQRVFARRYGYAMGSSSVSSAQQLDDQLSFSLYEMQTSQRSAAFAMAKAKDRAGKTRAFMDLYERPGDNSFGRRFNFAMDADRIATMAGLMSAGYYPRSPSHTITSETHIGDVHLHTNATDPKSHADAFRNGISELPLMNAADLSNLGLSTRGAQ